jgi:multidrug efflux system outer membrane protein
LLEAAERSYELSVARYRAGRDSYIVLLDVQRTLFLAREAMVGTRLAEQANRATLYKALGGGWITGQAGTR